MLVELDRWELVRLVTGLSPDYSDMNELMKRGFGQYIGGFNDRWDWNHNAIYNSKLFDEDIYDLYLQLKNK